MAEVARGSTPTADAWDEALRAGARIGRFELVRELGRGGFGVVWEARDLELHRAVAFKALRAGVGDAPRSERARREAEVAARLAHRNVVTLYDAGVCSFGPYLVLELLRGETLSARLARGPVPLPDALRIGAQVAAGLAHAHRQGVVHRDLTPGNVFLCDDGAVKVLDFGMAQAAGRRRLDGGTPSYMAPEQWRGAPEDERTDVFALGVLLYRLVAGELPFPRDGGASASGSRRAPELEVPAAPEVGALLARMLAKDPVDRPRDAAEVAALLAPFAGEPERTPTSPSRPVRRRSTAGRRAAWAGAAIALAAALVVAGALVARRAPGGARARAAPRVVVAVADLENRTAEPDLNGLSGMLITSLEQSRRLSVLTRVRLVDLLRQRGLRDVAGVDEALARGAARDAGVRALLVATLRSFDGLYTLDLRAMDPGTGEDLFALQERGRGKASIPGMLDRLSGEARRRLSESGAEVSASRVELASATTASFEAYEHYFRGDVAWGATRYAEALREYRLAVQADPSFALAHYRIAYLGEFTRMDPALRRAELEAAVERLDRIPLKERLLVEAWKAHADGREDDARDGYARAVAAYPADKEVLFMAADHLYHLGRIDECPPLLERAVELDPSWEPALMHLTDALADLGRVDELAARARSWVTRAPSAAAYRSLAEAAGLAGEREEAVRAARRAVELDGGSAFSRAALGFALDQAERYREAEALLREPLPPTATAYDGARLRVALAATLAYEGRRREAAQVLRRLPPLARPGQRPDLLLHLLGDGPAEEARAEALRLRERGSRWEGLPFALASAGALDEAEAQLELVTAHAWRAVGAAGIARGRGDAARALELLRPVLSGRDQRVILVALWLAATSAAALGRDGEAAELCARAQREPGEVLRSWVYPASLHLEAAALARLGERERARDRVETLLRGWARADPDLPLLRGARALRDRLAAEAGAEAAPLRGALGARRP